MTNRWIRTLAQHQPPLHVDIQLLVTGVVAGAFAIAPNASAQQDEGVDASASQVLEEQEPGIKAASSDPRLESAEAIDEDWFLLGRWRGWRTDLANAGVTFDIHWTQSFQGVVDGGIDTGFAYGGSLDYILDLNLDQMDVMPGAFVRIMAESRYGESVLNA